MQRRKCDRLGARTMRTVSNRHRLSVHTSGRNLSALRSLDMPLRTGKRHDDQHPELHTRLSRSNLSSTQDSQLQCLRTQVFWQHGQMLWRRERLLSCVQREPTDIHEAGNNGDAQEASVSVDSSSSSPPVRRICCDTRDATRPIAFSYRSLSSRAAFEMSTPVQQTDRTDRFDHQDVVNPTGAMNIDVHQVNRRR